MAIAQASAQAHSSQVRDINTPKGLLAVLYISVIGPAVFIVQPGFVLGLVEGYGFSNKQAGYIASAEMWGIAITTLLMGVVLHRVNWRTLMVFSALLIAAANFINGFVSDVQSSLAWSLVLRGLAGIGSGVFVSLSFTLIGLTKNPQRNFGLLVITVLCFGAFGLFVLPRALSLFGMDGVVIFFGLLALSGLPFIQLLPASAVEVVETDAGAVATPFAYKVLMIGAMAAYFTGQTAVWTYLYLIGLSGGVGEQAVANGLSVSNFFGIFGALLATLLGLRLGRILPTTLALAGGVFSLLFLFGQFTAFSYALIAGFYYLCWNFLHPFLLSLLSKIDHSGRVLAHGIAAQMLGTAIGPAVAALVVVGDDYASVLGLGIGLYILTLMLVMPLLIRLRAC